MIKRLNSFRILCKSIIILTPLFLCSCGLNDNTFEVEAEGAAAAELTLCDKITDLERVGSKFTTTQEITCEGHGAISVHFLSGPSIDCIVGYVTPGLVQYHRFEVKDKQCIELLD